MERSTVIKSQLRIVPNKDQYSILYSNNEQNWIHDMTHEHLIVANSFLNKISTYGSIDLQRWTKTNDEYEFVLLVNGLKPTKNKIHIWNGQDSYCSMWSTGGLKQDRHILTEHPPTDVFCSNCVDQYRRYVPKGKQKHFDEMYRLRSYEDFLLINNDIDPSLF